MPDNERKDKPSKPSGSTGEFVLPSSGEVTVQQNDLPAKPDKNRNVHLRRPLPPVPEPKDEQSDDEPPRDR
jgi:hypothetical protein